MTSNGQNHRAHASEPAAGPSDLAVIRIAKNWYRNLRVAGKLWLGFGLMFGVVASLGASVLLTVNQLEKILDHVTTVAEPLSAAAYEMEINALGSGMGVMSYLNTPDTAFVARFHEDQQEFQAFQRKYGSVAPSGEARALGRRAAATYDSFQALGAELIAAKDREVEALRRFSEAIGELDAVLQGDDGAPQAVPLADDDRMAGLAARIGTAVAEFSLSLTQHSAFVGAASRGAPEDQTAGPRNRLKQLTKLLAEADSTKRAQRLEASLERIFRLAEDTIENRRFIVEQIQIFADTRIRLDGILDEEVQIFAQQELLQNQRLAHQMSGELRLGLLGAGALVLLLSTVCVLILAKGIVGPVHTLAQGTKTLGRGDLAHRIRIASKDEIGQLAEAFNQMALQLQGATENLESEVSRRTGELRDAKRTLEEELTRRLAVEQQLLQAQKMESLGTLAGGIAHDFNNMLYVMLGSAEMAKQALPTTSRARRHLNRVLQAGMRSKTLVQQILSFGRRQAPELKPVAFDQILKNALALLRASLPPGIKLRTEIDRSCGTLLADGAQLEQAVVNLGVNAYQAIASGVGTITVGARRVHVDAEMAAEHVGLSAGEHMELEMLDTGGGIAADVLPRVMDPFFTTKPVGEGTGLGLSVVHGIVTTHGGTIMLASKPGEGTTVRVLLPIRSEAGKDTGAGAQARAARQRPNVEPAD